MSRDITGCDFGLHVSLTAEWQQHRFRPLAARHGAHVGDDGYCVCTTLDLFQRGPVLEQLIAEIRAQYDHATQAGLRISYVDEHMGCGWLHEPGHPERRLSHFLHEFCEENGLIWFASRHQGGIPRAALDDEAALHTFLDTHSGGFLYMTHPARNRGRIAADQLACRPGDESARRQVDYDRLINPRWAEIIREHGYDILRYSEAPVVRDGRALFDQPTN